MKLGHRIGLVDDYCYDKCLAIFKYFFIYFSSQIFKMSAKSFENNGKNISKNIFKLKLEQNMKSLLYNHLIYICAEETDF